MPDIEDLLFPAVQAVIDGSGGYPVKYPNRNGPENALIWIEVVHIPNGPATAGWNDLKANQGIMNIGVHVPPDNGSTDVSVFRSALCEAFKQGTVLRDTDFRVEIYTPPIVGAVFEDRQKSVYPVQIRYRSFEI